MRIAFISTIKDHAWGGADSLWTRAAEFALENGHKVLLGVSKLVSNTPRVQAILGKGAELVVRNPPRRGLRLKRSFARRIGRPWLCCPTSRSIERFGPDLVVVSGAGTFDLLLEPELTDWIASTTCQCRYIANWQQLNPLLNDADRIRLRPVLSKLDRVFFVSSKNRLSTERCLGFGLANAQILHNPITRATALPWPKDNEARFACVGRLAPIKGLDLLLYALAGMPDHGAWNLSIFGEGPDEEHLRALSGALGLTRKVRFLGFQENLDNIWLRHHILISPAIEEGGPMTIPEAMLRGRPVLATNVGAAEEWIVHRKTGWLCAFPSVESLRGSVDEALQQRAGWQEMGEYCAKQTGQFYRFEDYKQIIY